MAEDKNAAGDVSKVTTVLRFRVVGVLRSSLTQTLLREKSTDAPSLLPDFLFHEKLLN